MDRLRKLWSKWLRAVGLRPRRAPPLGPETPRLRRFARRPPRRLDARGLQGLLDDVFARRPVAPPEVEEPPRKAVGS